MSQCRPIRILRKIVIHRCQNCPSLVAGVNLIRSRHDPGSVIGTRLRALLFLPQTAGPGRARGGREAGEGGWPGDISLLTPSLLLRCNTHNQHTAHALAQRLVSGCNTRNKGSSVDIIIYSWNNGNRHPGCTIQTAVLIIVRTVSGAE